MEAALVLKENSQQPWKTVEERTVSDTAEKKDTAQSVAAARKKEASDVKPHSRSLRMPYFRSKLPMQ